METLHLTPRRGTEGFTLIELLVVVMIIGVLAGLAVPSMLQQRRRGWIAAAQSSLEHAVIAVESCGAAQQGSYTTPEDCTDAASLSAHGFRATAGVAVTSVSVSTSTFTLASTAASLPAAEDTFTWSSSAGTIDGPT